jgi:SAM-dependent methyltransferase
VPGVIEERGSKTAAEAAPRERVISSNGSEIIELSPPVAYAMANEWYQFASAIHFFFQWRFAVMQQVLGPDSFAEPVLEVGCGNAVARGQIEDHYGCTVDGCDVNPEALRQAERGRGKLYLYDIHQRRPEWRDHFATIFLLDTLEHIGEPERFLESIAYHLRPGGRLLITVPALPMLFSRYDEADGHVKRYRVGVLRQELAAAGLTLERHSFWGLSMIPVLLARKLILRFLPRERAIEVGFQPPSRLVDGVLRGLMHAERCLWSRPIIGTSFVALARKGV